MPVIAGLDPAIQGLKDWMPGSSPGMTEKSESGTRKKRRSGEQGSMAGSESHND
jgi:hypothetical protein